MKLRKSFAAVALAGAAVLATAGCSSDDVNDAVDNATSAVTSAAADASAAAESAVDDVENAISGLSTEDAQNILRTAVDANTSDADLDKVVDTTDPATKAALAAYAKASNAAGYTPDVYTVTEVKADGDDKAVATVSLKSPHAPVPVDLQLAFVKVDGDWKLAGDAVTQLTSMGGQHGS